MTDLILFFPVQTTLAQRVATRITITRHQSSRTVTSTVARSARRGETGTTGQRRQTRYPGRRPARAGQGMEVETGPGSLVRGSCPNVAEVDVESRIIMAAFPVYVHMAIFIP